MSDADYAKGAAPIERIRELEAENKTLREEPTRKQFYDCVVRNGQLLDRMTTLMGRVAELELALTGLDAYGEIIIEQRVKISQLELQIQDREAMTTLIVEMARQSERIVELDAENAKLRAAAWLVVVDDPGPAPSADSRRWWLDALPPFPTTFADGPMDRWDVVRLLSDD